MSSNVTKSLDLAGAMSNLVPSGQKIEPQSRSFDDNRVAKAEQQPDGSFRYSTEGATRGNYIDAVKGKNDPWEAAYDANTKTPLAAHQVTGDSVIRMNGAEVTVDQAVMMGWLARPSQGGTPAAAAPQGVAQETEQQQKPEDVHPDLQTEAVDMQTEQTFTALVEGTSTLTQIGAVNDLATDGEISERRIAELASQMQIEPTQVQAMVEAMRPAFEKQATSAIESYGVGAEDVMEWAQEARPREAQEAINRHLTMRNTHGYQKLAQHYVTHLDTINPDAILSAEVIGGKVERVGDKIVLTNSKGQRMSWSEALALGYKPQRVR
jgi:hypothetical protein